MSGVGDRHAVIAGRIGDQRPAVVLCPARSGSARRRPWGRARSSHSPAVRREGQAVGRAVAGAPGLGRASGSAREGVGRDHRRGLGPLGVARRIDDRNGGRAPLARLRVAGGGLAVQGQAQDLAQRLVGILGRRHALALAHRQEQILLVRREGDRGAELAALAPRARRARSPSARRGSAAPLLEGQLGPRQGKAGAAVAGFRIGEVDAVVGRIAGRDIDAQQAALAPWNRTAGALATGVFSPACVTSQMAPGFSVTSMRPSGRKARRQKADRRSPRSSGRRGRFASAPARRDWSAQPRSSKPAPPARRLFQIHARSSVGSWGPLIASPPKCT